MSDEDALADFLYTVPRLPFDEMFSYAYATSFSPNAEAKVPFCDYPYSRKNGELVLDADILKNFENGFGGFEEKITNHSEVFSALKTFVIDYGSNDEYTWIPEGCEYVSELLDQAGIAHELIMHSGTHMSQLNIQIRNSLLPVFSDNLTFDEKSNVPESRSAQIPEKTSLRNYPNPFNASTQIYYALDQKDHIKLTVYDMLGKEVSVLFNGIQTAGQHTLQLNGDAFSSGVYYYRLETQGHEFKTQKMVLLK